MRNFQKPGRAEAYGDNGMVATSHPLATLAARDVLMAGGSAADAAIAATAVLCLAEPAMTGIGGDCFWIHASGSGGITAYNGSGRCPSNFSLDLLEGVTALSPTSAHAVTVPGAVDAWCALHHKFGKADFETLLAPAIRLAEDGCQILPRVALDWQDASDRISQGAARDLFLANGVPRCGDRYTNPGMAMVLRGIAKKGREGFYQGDVATSLARTLQAAGGSHRVEDFETHHGTEVDPVSTGFHGMDVLECPPNGQGIFALLLMNLLSEAGGLPDGDADRIDRFGMLTQLAYEERNLFCGDPDFADIPVDRLLSREHAQALLGRTAELAPRTLSPHRDTVYLCVTDRDLNCVSFINSIFHSFGSGIVDRDTGVLFHNRGLGFSLQPGHPAEMGPGRRPLHTIIPGLVRNAQGRAVMPFGVMGGQYQAAGQAAFLYQVLAEGKGIQTAMDAPRSFALDGVMQVEETIPASARTELANRGWKVESQTLPIGGGQAILIDHDRGIMLGASDFRKDGLALGL